MIKGGKFEHQARQAPQRLAKPAGLQSVCTACSLRRISNFKSQIHSTDTKSSEICNLESEMAEGLSGIKQRLQLIHRLSEVVRPAK